MTEVSLGDRIKTIFKLADTDHSGSISRKELEKVFINIGDWTPEEFSELFAQADVNQDDQLDYDEFVDWLMSDSLAAFDPGSVKVIADGLQESRRIHDPSQCDHYYKKTESENKANKANAKSEANSKKTKAGAMRF
eukprot:gnl/MRDRNA2_/MRDRNA2_17087_c0_seq1.p1 gnl/MRDRNA2_/MRDRNA2_17087_c0~~gnl/MRDRNA2_/MRDRNA2_17087_c0_seq1.p1  ORF type:complete len:136 (-),score=35.51 gnl/MRDRNA2_/MRDRNA2_17087_c0_seq1:100-507(-)